MSHKATNWAVQQRGIKPSAKVVLWHLADRHSPDNGCFPSQERLAEDCEMSRSSLNDQLRALEDAGLIRREQRMNAKTKRVQSTRYILGFEFEQAQQNDVPCPKSGHGAVSENGPEPCPKKPESRVQNSDTNPVREPVREPGASAPSKPERFSEAWAIWPKGQGRNCGQPEAARAYWSQWKAGADEGDLIAACRAYAKQADPEYALRFDKFMRDEVWREHAPPPSDPAGERDAWRVKLEMWARNGRWPSSWGPDPDSPNCQAPRDLIANAQERAA